MKKKFNHAFTLAFSLESNHEEGDDLTSDDYKRAIMAKIEEMDHEGEIAWDEMMGMPFDTYEIEEK